MKRATNIHYLILLLLFITGCKKESDLRQVNPENDLVSKVSALNTSQTKFAKILAKSVQENSSLRSLIKDEALKQFDQDYDVLYQKIKDKNLSNTNETVHELLIRTGGTSKKELDSIINEYPLLTIFIPKLPGFSAESWNAVTESPLVAPANIGEKEVTLYGPADEKLTIGSDQIPSFPILVVKQNERITVKKNNLSATTGLASAKNNNGGIAFQNENVSLSFIDKAFDGTITNSLAKTSLIQSVISSNDIDPINIAAYNSGNEWHRDYIYYGITASSPNGEFKHNYSEFITSFKFLTPDALSTISDQDGDPKNNGVYGVGNWTGATIDGQPLPSAPWTEGNFEFKITVLLNAKNGTGTELVKILNARAEELFDVQYELFKELNLLGRHLKIYSRKSITPKEYHPNIELVPWDLENYGTAWKFIIYETDNAQEINQSYENSTTYAGNFGIDLGVSKKIGLKFGGSATTTSKNTYSVKTTLNSDFLGEAILSFDQPIIIGTVGSDYNVREITTGNNLSITVQPKRVF